MEEMNTLIEEKVIRKTLEDIILKNGQPALTLYDDSTHLYIRSQSKYLPVVALIQTEFAGQDPMGTGPTPPRLPVQFALRALFLGREMVQAVFYCFKVGFVYQGLIGAGTR